MARQKNLSALHATLPVSQRANAPTFSAHRTYPLFYTSAPDWQSGITCHFCSRRRHPACQRAHARMGRAARAVLNHGVSPHTPSYYDDRIVQNFSLLRRAIPDWRNSIIFQPRTRRYTRMMERHNLSAQHAPSPSGLPESACSHRLCLPHTLSPRTTPSHSEGAWGLCPHVSP